MGGKYLSVRHYCSKVGQEALSKRRKEMPRKETAQKGSQFCRRYFKKSAKRKPRANSGQTIELLIFWGGSSRSRGIGDNPIVIGFRRRAFENHPKFGFEVIRDLRMAVHIGFRRIAAIADLLARDHIPVAGFLDQAIVDAEINDLAIFGKAMPIEEVHHAGLERRRHLILDDFDLHGVANDLRAILNRIGPS